MAKTTGTTQATAPTKGQAIASNLKQAAEPEAIGLGVRISAAALTEAWRNRWLPGRMLNGLKVGSKNEISSIVSDMANDLSNGNYAMSLHAGTGRISLVGTTPNNYGIEAYFDPAKPTASATNPTPQSPTFYELAEMYVTFNGNKSKIYP